MEAKRVAPGYWQKDCQALMEFPPPQEPKQRTRGKSRKAKGELVRPGVRNLVIVSDLHCGCVLGLCPPCGIRYDQGGVYKPSRLQRIMWRWWEEFWGQWVPAICRNEPYAVLVNGDAIDNEHHGVKTLITNNIHVQRRLAIAILKPIRQKAVKMYFTRGTDAHDGGSGQEIEAIAEALGATPDEEGCYARWQIWIQIGKALVHAAHPIGSNASEMYESTAVHKELIEAYVEAGRWHRRPPDFVVRSHRHRAIGTDIPSAVADARSIVTPGWQFKTPFAYQRNRLTPPQIGGHIIRQGDYHAYDRRWYRTPGRPRVEVL